jgi:hypothetical protein
MLECNVSSVIVPERSGTPVTCILRSGWGVGRQRLVAAGRSLQDYAAVLCWDGTERATKSDMPSES